MPPKGRDVRMAFHGVVADFMDDTTRHIDLEGAFRSGKTTAALWKVYHSCVKYPGIHWLICRFSDGDTHSVLKGPWREILRRTHTAAVWDAEQQCDVFPNGSVVFILGLKAQDAISRYGKLRGRTLAGVYVDQAEELPHDIFLELIGRLSQEGFPHQLLLTPNPPDENHWLAQEFPESNHLKDRRYYSVPVYANAHNLPAETIAGLERAYPPAHPKHRSAVLGRRGLNVIGKPVYGGDPQQGLAPSFVRALHVRPLALNPDLPLCEAIDFGKHHPCIVLAQFTPYAQLLLLGGVMGQDLYLDEFVEVALQYRAQWFPQRLAEATCCDPAGSHDNSQGLRNNGVRVLADAGITASWKDNSNAPDVRFAMVERLAAYMRRRTAGGEGFGVEANPARWVLVSKQHVRPWAFVADGLEAGYVWDEHYVSVGSKQVRKPKKDGWYEHGQNCLEYLELNFGGAQPSVQQSARTAARVHRAALVRAQQDTDPFRWSPHAGGRGGY